MTHKKMILLITFLSIILSVFTSDRFKYLGEESFLYGIATTSVDNRKNTRCYKDLQHFLDGAQKNEPWVLRMLDSSGAMEHGYLFGHTLWMGSRSECEDIPNNKGLIIRNKQIFPPNSFPPYKIIFMSVVLNHNNTIQAQFRIPINNYLHVGLCMPESCTNNDLTRLLEQFLNKKKLLFQKIYPVQLNIAEVKSLRTDQIDWYKDSMVFLLLIFIGITLILTTVGTWYDIFVQQPKININKDVIIKNNFEKQDDNFKFTQISQIKKCEEPHLFFKIALCYSIVKNIEGIFKIKKEPASALLPFIHGIKTWGMFYIILLHGVLFQNIFVDNAYSAYRLAAMFFNQILSNPSYAVDTFFCLGGFLLSYLFYKIQKEHNRQISVLEGVSLYFKMVFHRYMRLTPAYFIVLLLSYTFWQMVGQEYPLIQMLPMEKIGASCPQYWWRNLLYITTYYTREDMCLTWSWYLSNDMQYFLLAGFLLLISVAYLKPVLNIFYLLILISIVVSGRTSYIHKYVPTLEEQILQLEVIYYPLVIRMSPYFVGILAGYYIHQWNYKIPLNKSTITKISWAALLTDLYIIHGVYTRENLPNLYISVYMGFSRTLWGLTIAWLLMICISGNAGIINKFLSFPGWAPISRLTYCIYLIHPILILLFGYTSDRPVHMSYSIVITSAIGIFTLSICAAFILCLLFESPYILLLKMSVCTASEKKQEKIPVKHKQSHIAIK